MNLKKFNLNDKIIKKRKLFYLMVHLFCTNNNTIITVTDKTGKTVKWSTSSSVGFKNSKKSLSYSAQICAENILKPLRKTGLKNIDIIIKGFGPGKEFAIKGLFNTGVNINSITDKTPIPHNGCKPKKLKRN